MNRLMGYAALLGWTALLNPPAHAQQVCNPCVRLTLLAELSTSPEPIVPSTSQTVFQSSDGKFFVSHRFGDPQIAVYDSAGRFLQLYTARGGGPGEFINPPMLFPAGGGDIWALDRIRLVLFDSHLRHIKTSTLPDQFFASYFVRLSDSMFVATARTSAPGDTLFSVRMVNNAWRPLRTIEHPVDRYTFALIAPARPNGFWSLGIYGTLLRRYDDSGVLVDSMRIQSPYFVGNTEPLPSAGVEGIDIPPRPYHTAAFDPGGEYVIIATRLAGERWEPVRRDRQINLQARDNNARFDTMLGVIDRANGRTVASQRFTEYLSPVEGAPDLLFSTVTDSDGHVITKVYRLGLVRQ